MTNINPASGFISGMTAIVMLLAMTVPVVASGIGIHPEQVLSVVTADWNDDGGFDRAVLVESVKEAGSTELLIFL